MSAENELARAVRNSKKGIDPRVDDIIDYPDGVLAKLHAKALASWENKLRKSYIEAARMASDDVELISKIVEIPADQLQLYYDFFFDIKEWDRLDKIEHIEKLGFKQKAEALLKMWTLTQGLDFLAWRLGKKVTISPVEGLVDLFSTCMFRSKEAMFNNAGTDSSAEAIKWSKQTIDIARLLKLWTLDSAAAKKDLEIAIREVVPEFGGLDELLRQDQEDLRGGTVPAKLEEAVGDMIVADEPDLPGLDELKDGNE